MSSRFVCNTITCLNGKPIIFVHGLNLQNIKFVNKI